MLYVEEEAEELQYLSFKIRPLSVTIGRISSDPFGSLYTHASGNSRINL